jgi:hypothetical protein
VEDVKDVPATFQERFTGAILSSARKGNTVLRVTVLHLNLLSDIPTNMLLEHANAQKSFFHLLYYIIFFEMCFLTFLSDILFS